MNLGAWGSRKFIVALVAIGVAAWKPSSATPIASIAIAFFAAHAVADSKLAK
jgi:hypothetical protein